MNHVKHIRTFQRAERLGLVSHKEAVRRVRWLTLAYYHQLERDSLKLAAARTISGRGIKRGSLYIFAGEWS